MIDPRTLDSSDDNVVIEALSLSSCIGIPACVGTPGVGPGCAPFCVLWTGFLCGCCFPPFCPLLQRPVLHFCDVLGVLSLPLLLPPFLWYLGGIAKDADVTIG